MALHGRLLTTLDEDAEHRTEYVGMLASPHASVAGLAVAALRRLDDAGRLDPRTTAEADDLLAVAAAAADAIGARDRLPGLAEFAARPVANGPGPRPPG